MNECAHGHLARKCELCERDGRIAELERVLELAWTVIAQAHGTHGDECKWRMNLPACTFKSRANEMLDEIKTVLGGK